MAVIGTFGSFTAARMGIYASQTALNVAGNNIANINTNGYTRQRLDLVALHSWGTPRYASKMNQDIGYGVLTNGVSQLRDPFLDIRYRNEQANVGASETWLDSLRQLSHTLDEVGMGDDFGIIEKQFNDFKSQLQQLNGAVGTPEYDTTARGSAQVLCQLFNTYAKALDTVENNEIKKLKSDVIDVNTILTQIRGLNEEIREAGIHGAKALELRDERNVLIDDLAKYIKIDVSYDLEKIDEFNSVERLNINLADSGLPPIRLICGIYGTQIEMPDMAPMRNPNYNFDDPNAPENFTTETRETKDDGGNVIKTETVKVPVKKYVVGIPNEKYNPNDPTSPKYVAAMENEEYNPDQPDGPGNQKYIPSDGTKYAYTDNPVTAEQAKAEAEEKGLPEPQNDPNNPWALAVDNALEGADNKGEDRLWMNLQPLVNEKGRVFRNSDGEESVRVDLGDNLLYGALQSRREFITGKGEFSTELDMKFDKDATTTRGVPYYRLSLDALAKKFAEEFNLANTGGNDGPKQPNDNEVTYGIKTETGTDNIERFQIKDNVACDLVNGTDAGVKAVIEKIAKEKGIDEGAAKDYLLRVDLSGLSKDLQAEIRALQKEYLSPEDVVLDDTTTPPKTGRGCGEPLTGGGILFSSNGDDDIPTGITAANITISKSWSIGDVRLLNTKKFDLFSHSTADDNIAHMINLMNTKMDYMPQEIAPDAGSEKRYFNGTFQERFRDMNVILAEDQQTTNTLYDSYSIKSLSLENDRQSVSGVDLNDEALNMMVFQKSYAAACQLMTTLDSMLDKLINGTIRT